jgi:hypothetical protein
LHLAARTIPILVVLLWLDEPGNPFHVERIIEASVELARRPGVTALRIGDPPPSDRPVVDSSPDPALVFTFADARTTDRSHRRVLSL